ncbi:MAG: toxin-antitoxin system YwqK family antitoxin [Pirellulaceae bacterium]
MRFGLTSQYTHRPAATLVFLVCLGSGVTFTIFTVAYWYEKSVSLDDGGTLFYRGFGIETTEGTVLGRRYTRAVFAITVPEDGFCEVDFARSVTKRGTEYYPFIANYPDGSARAKGIGRFTITDGFVDREGNRLQPSVALIKSGEGVFFQAGENVRSAVRDGTGVETFWTHAGVKVWELNLRDYEREKLTTWHRNGKLKAEYAFKDGSIHGIVRFYDPSGNLAVTVVYEDGKEKERSPPY